MKTASLIIIIAIAFVIAVIITKYEIPVLRRKAGQNIREEGLKSHYSKAGTPSMGGISFIIAACIATIIATIAFNGSVSHAIAILIVFLGFGAIGFIDDYLKVIKKQNEGLKAKQKFGLQIIIAVVFAILYTAVSDYGTQVYIPIADVFVNFCPFYYLFIVFAVLAMTNAVTLTEASVSASAACHQHTSDSSIAENRISSPPLSCRVMRPWVSSEARNTCFGASPRAASKRSSQRRSRPVIPRLPG